MKPTHPHAKTALQLAGLKWPKRDHISQALNEPGCPRRLYTLARVLRAAQIMDEIAAADARRLRAAIEAKTAADSAALDARWMRTAIEAKSAVDSAALLDRIARFAKAA
ncbi:MAG: hypothetical protein ROZ09_11605 [Thiobacillus sp.]|uniref:hypothetical protein n=1 Tax=Thiobacillus sp. TaxID=924 RepID=UPI0028947351|nr:hypothetical protein [Thiobacillus sp.]MDT3707465.1 hypothetical protein [Thiobacillus sp.]